MEKHGYVMTVDFEAGATREQIREKIHQVQKAICEIERRMRQSQCSAKQDQLNNIMRSILLSKMDVAEVYSPPRIRS